MSHPSSQPTASQNSGSPITALLVALVLAWMYLHFFAFKAFVELEIDTGAARPDFVNIYWTDDEGYFNESDKNRVRINNQQTDYHLFIGSLGESRKLRIDPMEYKGKIKLRKLSITQFGYAPIVLDGPNDFARIKPANHVEPPVYDDDGLIITATGNDPQVLLEIAPVKHYFLLPIQHVVALIAIFILVWLCHQLAAGLFVHLAFVPAALLVVLVLVITMASVTGEHVHPDETVHMAAVDFYSEHNLPPAVDSPLIDHTFSVYGMTRLASYEMYYQLAGYFTRMLQPFQLSSLLSARFFGVSLLLILLLFSVKRPDFRYFLLPILASAQAWYLFSYVNSDGYALFLAVIVSYQAACKKSLFNQFVQQASPHWFWPKALGLGLLFGSLLLLKSNYYFFILFVGLYLLWRFFIGDFPDKKRFWTRLGVLAIIGVSLYGARFGLDIAANGVDSSERMSQQTEIHAKELYKPSTPLEQKHAYLYMKSRGVTLEEIISLSRWAEKTFITAFGAYGFTQFLGTEIFYDLVRYTGALILLLMLFSLLLTAPPSSHWLFGFALGSATLLIAAAFWHSWTVSFQPQGRYMMPILPIIAMVYYQFKHYLPRRLIVALACGLFLLSLYSFVFIGLHDVPKLDHVL